MLTRSNCVKLHQTSEIGTTSLQGTKAISPKRPLLGGSTVYIKIKARVLVNAKFLDLHAAKCATDPTYNRNIGFQDAKATKPRLHGLH